MNRNHSTCILGIHDGHNAGASLIIDGSVVASVSEERLTRKKNEVGYPEKSIEEVLRIGGVDASELSEVAYASLFMHRRSYLTDVSAWYRVGISEQRASEKKPSDYADILFRERKNERIQSVVRHLEISEKKISFTEHHLCHLAAAYYTCPWRRGDEPLLGLTCDGAGDNLSATVSILDESGIRRIAESDRHASLGKIYSRATFLMGMTPWEHEYKLMGLAPYADPARVAAAAEPLRRLLTLDQDGLQFKKAGELSTNYSYEFLRDAFERVRFDTIAGAVQLFTEDALVAWVKKCVAKTGLRRIVTGGGVFMNVKANMMIADLPDVEALYVMPSAGDESLSIGAGLYRHHQLTGAKPSDVSRIDNVYWGGEFSRKDEVAAIETASIGERYLISEPRDMNVAIADLLADGQIVALCRGRMEWGARALGNRSIIASADQYGRVDEINRAIKMRDFWMPFAPSVIEDAASRYFDDPKDLMPWFMTFAFATKPEAYSDLAAGSHPRDHTIRPQVVRAAANPNYYATIAEFGRKTGRGGVLNTSFNLHGEPIVYSPADALRVLAGSGLQALALGHHLIVKSN